MFSELLCNNIVDTVHPRLARLLRRFKKDLPFILATYYFKEINRYLEGNINSLKLQNVSCMYA